MNDLVKTFKVTLKVWKKIMDIKTAENKKRANDVIEERFKDG